MVGHYLHRKGSVEICITISGVVLVLALSPVPTNISDSLVRWKIFNWKTFTDYTSKIYRVFSVCALFGRNGLKCEFEIHLEILLELRDSKLS